MDIKYNIDCRHFRGDVPCKPHKEFGVHCIDCSNYEKTDGTILIIKLGAIGDVIRTTPLLHKIKQEYPNHIITWLTYSPDIVPSSFVDNVFPFNLESIIVLQNSKFSLLINLDKDLQACSLASSISAEKKAGFIIENNKPVPANSLAKDKYLTGLFDDVNKANKKNYLEEIFEICGWNFKGEEYILDFNDEYVWDIQSEGKSIVGLNTGCGDRWRSRLWKDEYWLDLISRLQAGGYFPLLLGGAQEHEKNKSLSEKSGAYYPGNFSLKQFISLMNRCDSVVTAVTMGLHIAIGLKKNVVLMNNIFNPNEFELYNRGEIISPDKECKCFFSPNCKNDDYFCLEYLKPDKIFEAVKRGLAK